MTDASGNLTYAANFDPYGNPLEQNLMGGTTNLGYTGAPSDPSGLVYLNARFYNPSIGSFQSHDPLEGDPSNPASFNGYSYTGGNPVTYTDRSGKCFDPISFFVCAVVLAALAGAGTDAAVQVYGIAANHQALSSFDWGQTLYFGGQGAEIGAAGGAIVSGIWEVGAGIAGAASIVDAVGVNGAIQLSVPGLVSGGAAASVGKTALAQEEPAIAQEFNAVEGLIGNASEIPSNISTVQTTESNIVVDPIVDNNVLVRAYRAYVGNKVYDGDAEALQLLQNPAYQWKVPPEVYEEFTGVPIGASGRQQFLNDLPNLDVISAEEAQQLQNGVTFQETSTRLRAIANRSAPGLGDPVVPGGRSHTHYNDIISLAYGEEMGIPFVTDDKKFIQFLNNQDQNNSYNIFHYLNFP